MKSRNVAASLIFAAMLGFGCGSAAHAAAVDCSLPIGKLTAAQFESCTGGARDQARAIPLRIGDVQYRAAKPTTQRAYDDLLHAGD